MFYLLVPHVRPIATTAMNRLADKVVRCRVARDFPDKSDTGSQKARGFEIRRGLNLGLIHTARLSLRLILNLRWVSCCIIGPRCMVKERELKVNMRRWP